MNNEIILRSVYGKVNQTYFIQPCPNPKTGKLESCVKTVDSNGDMILSEKDKQDMSEGIKFFIPADEVFEIVDGTHFDLDDVVEKAKWDAIKYCNWIAKDRYERDAKGDLVIDGGAKRYGTAELYVERPGEITKVKISKKQLVHRASGYIYDDSLAEKLKKCKVLGRDLKGAMESDVTDYLITIAEKTPNKIIDLYEGEDWKMQLFILDAIDRGVISRSDGIYKYKDKILGASMEATVLTLKDVSMKALRDSIKIETYPDFLSPRTIEKLQEDVTDGIPHFNSDDNEEKLTPQEKAKRTKAAKAAKLLNK